MAVYGKIRVGSGTIAIRVLPSPSFVTVTDPAPGAAEPSFDFWGTHGEHRAPPAEVDFGRGGLLGSKLAFNPRCEFSRRIT